MEFPTLYHEARTGKLHSWRVWTEGAHIWTEYGTDEGEKNRTCKLAIAKNVGKKNATTAEQQAEREAQAMWQKKLDRKYRRNRDAARETVFLPMLAHDWTKQKKLPEMPVDTQPKLDGVRCMAYWKEDNVILMSRAGKEYTVPHISFGI